MKAPWFPLPYLFARTTLLACALAFTGILTAQVDGDDDDDDDDGGLPEGDTFGFTSQMEGVDKGEVQTGVELEWSASLPGDDDYDSLEYAYEIEYGISDRFELGFGLSWEYEDGRSVDDNGSEFSMASVEAYYQ